MFLKYLNQNRSLLVTRLGLGRNMHKLVKFNFSDLNKSDLNNNVKSLLKEIKLAEGENKSILDGHVYDIQTEGNKVKILLNLDKNYIKIKNLITKKLQEDNFQTPFEITMAPAEKKSESNKKIGLKNVKNIIAVSSCKGGVGKSTVAINLAFALQQQNKKIGIFDADIYGPSLPTLINPNDPTLRSYEDNPSIILPIDFANMKAMSYGFAAQGRRAIMRGPIVSNVVTTLIGNTDWGDLDYLVVDMPPGTGDIQITLCQEINFTGAVVVTTPQKLSFIDVVKGMEMFDELKIPILSVVENMSYFMCGKCDTQHQIFGKGYVDMLKQQFGIEESYKIPIDPMISRCSDSGSPFVMITSETDQTFNIFKQIATNLIKKVDKLEEFITSKPQVTYKPTEGCIEIVHSKNQIKKVSANHLRKKCICAACIDEFTGEKLLKEKQIPDDVHPTRIEDKGNYAVAIVWSDGHRSSIYPYKRLLSTEVEEMK